METVIALGMLVLTAFSVVLTVFIYKSSKREKKLTKYVEGEIKVRQFTRATGSLAYHTAYAVHKANLCNGEVNEAMQYYKKREHDLEDYYQENAVLTKVKGV